MKAAPCGESWSKKCSSQSLLWLRLHCRAELWLPVQNGPCLQSSESFFQKCQLAEISSSHTAIPAWTCLFLLAFNSLSFISWSLTLKKFVHTRNCMHSSYPLSWVTCFQHDTLLLYFSFLAYRKLFPYVNFFFVLVVAFPPPAGVQWNVCSFLRLVLSLIKLNNMWSLWLLDIAPSWRIYVFQWAAARCKFYLTYLLLLIACHGWQGFVWCPWAALLVSGRGMGGGRRKLLPRWLPPASTGHFRERLVARSCLSYMNK